MAKHSDASIAPSKCVRVTLEKSHNQNKQWKGRVGSAKENFMKAGKPQDDIQATVPSEDAIFDVKFCPYLPKGAPPVFAFTSGQSIFVAKLSGDAERPFSVIRAIEDLDEGRNTKTPGMDSFQCHNSIAWMRDRETGDPLLLFSGNVPKIHVYNVAKAEYVRTLTGHGSGVQEIVPHPTNPSIFATCSDDNEVRLWNLDSQFDDSWCAVICHGEFGHTSTVYSIAFTKNGRYLMSGGRDTWMHLWALPDVEELMNLPREKVKSRRIYYPHFSSADVHCDIVDCIRFYGDLIISRCVGFKLTIWAIDGFSSDGETPDPPTKHVQGQRTCSAFGTGFTVLYSFTHMKSHVQPFYYHRFNVFSSPTGRPVLAMGDLGEPTLHFWDLLKLELDRASSGWDGDPLEAMNSHDSFTPFLDKEAKNSISFFRALDWSSDGKWLVAGYDGATLLVCWR